MLLLSLLSGCAVIDALASKDAAAGCQVADVASTHYALHHNPNTYETSFLSVPVLDVIKLILASYIKWGMDDDTWNAEGKPIRILITAVGCGAAVHNMKVAKER